MYGRSFLMVAVASFSLGLCSCATNYNEETIDHFKQARFAGFTEYRSARYAEAVKHYRRAVQFAREISPPDLRLPVALNDLGRAYAAAADSSAAYEAFKAALEALQRLKPAGADADADVAEAYAQALGGMASAEQSRSDPAAAEKLYEQALSYARKAKSGSEIRTNLIAYQRLLVRQGRADKARAVAASFNQEVDAADPLPAAANDRRTAYSSHSRAGEELLASGDLAGARLQYREAMRAALSAGNSVGASTAACRLGTVACKQQSWLEARGLFSESLNMARKTADKDLQRSALQGLTVALTHLQRFDAAEAAAKQAVEISKDTAGVNSAQYFDDRGSLADVYGAAHKLDAELEIRQEAYNRSRLGGGLDSPQNTVNMYKVAHVLCQLQRSKEAQKVLADYSAALSALPAPAQMMAARTINDFGDVCLKSGWEAEAPLFGQCACRVLGRLRSGQDAHADAEIALEMARAVRLSKK